MSLKNIDLYPHNQETYTKIIDAWTETNKVAVVQATGTGKTYLILKCMSNFMFQTKVILAPSHYILNQLKSLSDGSEVNTIYMTYSKLSFMSHSEISELQASLIVLDEFHRCGADVWGRGVERLLEANPNAKMLGTSATPIRFLDNERDMSDELFDGKVVTNLNLADAVVQGILPMPKYISSLFSIEDEVNKLNMKIQSSRNSDSDKQQLFKDVEALKRKLNKSKGAEQILHKHIDRNVKKFIIFCKDIKHLVEMSKIVPKWFLNAGVNGVKVLKVYTEYLNSDKEFDYFRNSKDDDRVLLLFSVDMLNEGVHVEDVDGVILLRPTNSPNVYYQQIGRAIQAGSNKSPLIFDFVNNFENVGSKQFIMDLKEATEKAVRMKKAVVDVPQFLIIDEVQEVKEMFEAIENRIGTDWHFSYEKLKEYYEKYGHTRFGEDGYDSDLSIWASRQRTYYKKGMLGDDKVAKLDSLDFVWDALEDNWTEYYELLIEYKEAYGNFSASANKEFKGKNLGNWVNKQRFRHKKGKLSDDRVQKLDEIGFWSVKGYRHKWEDRYQELKEFYDINGNHSVNRREYGALYVWISRQRDAYKQGKLSDEEISKLKDIKFQFEK
ncbi:hypothetical protein CN984_12090 [Bacillus cereus]|uniref:Uncharacterized protein n=1 Tax=Bacillus cereus TaxID=1396 RepID=A0A2A7FNF7_BACCE|nr:Helicase associated domain protein [Bacillus cereus]PEA25840.1 hypothetical protein CON44_18005 [Bacillus cereus]PGO29179.1 hypothetical protein CN984_12090 [Bacillus cereus]